MWQPTFAHPNDTHTIPYVQGWVSMMVMWEGLDRAKSFDGPGIKAPLETLRDFDTGGLTAPISFTPTDHRPTTTLKIIKVDNAGKLAEHMKRSIKEPGPNVIEMIVKP